ncbi:MAG: cupin [Chloroflexi bacterium]|nr:cupin [Chloroflexota bacterium]
MSDIFNQIKIVDKPWGQEVWFAITNKYAGKVIYVKKGKRLSLQYHEKKMESMLVLEGELKLIYGTDSTCLQEVIIGKGQAITILPHTIHRTIAVQDTTILEVSTPEMEDVVRLSDDYNRLDKKQKGLP